MQNKQKVFVLSGALAFTAALVVGGLLGMNNMTPPASAGSELPDVIRAEDVGDGGLVASSVVLAADSPHYQVWTAQDRAGNICTVSYAIPEGNSSVVCGPNEMLEERGIAGSMQVGVATEDDPNTVFLQTYLLPESVDTRSALGAVEGAEAYGNLLVRYGHVDQRGDATIEIPTENGSVVRVRVLGSN